MGSEVIARPSLRPLPPLPEEPLPLLLACHGRIRDFSGLAVRLAAPSLDATHEQIASAAASVERYFRIGLSLHIADEEESLRPRLERVHSVASALALMTREHDTIDRELQRLLPTFAEVAREPMRRFLMIQEEARLRDVATQLAAHLQLEEAELFPLIHSLPAATRTEIFIEMRRRRR